MKWDGAEGFFRVDIEGLRWSIIDWSHYCMNAFKIPTKIIYSFWIFSTLSLSPIPVRCCAQTNKWFQWNYSVEMATTGLLYIKITLMGLFEWCVVLFLWCRVMLCLSSLYRLLFLVLQWNSKGGEKWNGNKHEKPIFEIYCYVHYRATATALQLYSSPANECAVINFINTIDKFLKKFKYIISID